MKHLILFIFSIYSGFVFADYTFKGNTVNESGVNRFNFAPKNIKFIQWEKNLNQDYFSSESTHQIKVRKPGKYKLTLISPLLSPSVGGTHSFIASKIFINGKVLGGGVTCLRCTDGQDDRSNLVISKKVTLSHGDVISVSTQGKATGQWIVSETASLNISFLSN